MFVLGVHVVGEMGAGRRGEKGIVKEGGGADYAKIASDRPVYDICPEC